MIVLQWLGTKKYEKDGKSPTLIDEKNRRWDWGFVEKALNSGQDIKILGKEEKNDFS